MAIVTNSGSDYPFSEGALGGIVAGTAFMLAEMFFNSMLGRPFLGPPRLIASIVMGKGVLMPGHGGVSVLVVGFIVHYILSVIFGVVSIWVISRLVRRWARSWTLVALGFLGGMIVWGINFYIIAPFLFPQFGMVNAFWNGFVAHAIYGIVFGLFLMMRAPLVSSAARG